MPSNWLQMAPGISAPVQCNWKALFTHKSEMFLGQGRYLDGALSRDPSNTVDVSILQPGLITGKVTASGLYAPSIYGRTVGALAGTGTTVTLASAAVGTEILRRRGATGTVKLTGPPSAAGTVRSSTVTYSAIVGTAMTIAAAAVNEVQRVNFNIASTGGNLQITFTDATTGARVPTANIAWNATDATYLAAINAALDTATGVAGGIVATAIAATDTDLGFVLTFSGTGYAGRTHDLVAINVLPTSSTSSTVTRQTTGSSGAFVTGSLIQPVDGSETPLSFISDWTAGVQVTDDSGVSVAVVDHPPLPTFGEIDVSQMINWPTDTALATWLMGQLSSAWGGKFMFAGVGGVY